MSLSKLVFVLLALVALPAAAGELPAWEKLAYRHAVATAVGVTRRDTPIQAFVGRGDDTRRWRVVLIGGFDGERGSVDAVLKALEWFDGEDAAEFRRNIHLSAIPCANPDGVLLDKGTANSTGGRPGEGYPRGDKFYQSVTHVEAQYVARWLEYHRADVVIEIRAGGKTHIEQRKPDKAADKAELVDWRADRYVLTLGDADGATLLRSFLAKLSSTAPAEQEKPESDDALVRRLMKRYVKPPASGAYFDTLPLLAAQRLEAIGFEKFAVEFTIPAAPKSGSDLSGLIFLRERGDRLTPAQLAALRAAADLAFDKGEPRAEPPFHNQMSDAVFMNGPLLSGVAALTKEAKYLDACARQQAFVRKICRRDDGLYRHSPLNDAAWGRGNGFVALGLALMLEDWPAEHPERKALLAEFQSHLAALSKHQDATGMWHQVIDRPESYREFTCTAMIGFAMARGVRGGWLERDAYQSRIDRAWAGAKQRTLPDGGFCDVCTGTGKQKTLRDYYDREALRGPDARGGSMMLLFASEMLRKK